VVGNLRALGCPRSAEWLFVGTVARALGKPRRTVRDWCQKGYVQARQAGKTWQINHDSLDDFLDDNAVSRKRNHTI